MAVSILSGSGGSQVELEPNDTLHQVQVLGDLSTLLRTDVVGTIGDGPAGAADVDWYSFTLEGPAHISLDLQPRGSDHPLGGVISLYNNDPFDFMDQYNPLGFRLLAQAVGAAGGDPRIERDLGPGTYEVAISGAGNLNFHPLIAGSGFAGATGTYDLRLVAGAMSFGPGAGPAVLTSDPAPNAVLDSSPFVIRLDFGSALDPATVIAGQTVRLAYNPNGTFGDGNDQDVPLASTNVGVGGTELQLAPAAPLAPGYYQVSLAGDSTAGTPVVADLNGISLGASDAKPRGQDYTETFRVNGIEGNRGAGTAADDTAAHAHDLGNITATTNVVQVAGAIGDDPYYDNSDPAHSPGNDVDLYHFQISGPGRYALVAEVFAGRIGSPLDPGVSLYRLDPADHTLHFVAGNNNSWNPTLAADRSVPLLLDPSLSQGLTAGDYYLAVAGGFNTTSPSENQPVGVPGSFDPNSSHSGQNGFGTGAYVLNLSVHATPNPPRVVSTSLTEGTVLDGPPTQFTVRFTEPVNLQQLGFENYAATLYCSIPSVYFQGLDGKKLYPRLDAYDQATNQATFLMLDRLPTGSYTLHLSGPGGLADLGGNPLVGNDPTGDFVVHLTVNATDVLASGSSWQGGRFEARPDAEGTQDLGVLFPHELQTVLTLDYNASEVKDQTPGIGQRYRFTLLQDTIYFFRLLGDALPQGATMTLREGSGHIVLILNHDSGRTWFGDFMPGSYVLEVGGMASDTSYHIAFQMIGSSDDPVPLVTGPAPSLQLRFESIAPPSPPGGSTSTGGGTTPVLPGPPGGGSGNPVSVAPSPFDPSTGPSPTIAPGDNNPVTPGPILVTVNLPASDPITPATGPVGGPATVVTAVTTVVIVDHTATSAGNSVVNIASANLVTMGVGPVGGVQQVGDTVASSQAVQVTLQTPANVPVPIGLVSLVTLTQIGDVGEMIGPEDQGGLEVAALAAADLPQAPAVAPAPAGPASRLEEALQDMAASWAGAPAPSRDVAGKQDSAEGPVRADTDVQLASEIPVGVAGNEGISQVGDAGGVEVGSLARLDGPWFFILAALGAVTVYGRRSRQARGSAASRDGADAQPTRSLFRLWGRHASRKASFGRHSPQAPHVATPRPNACPRPKHLSNP